jgi:hypothetical protein
MSVLSLTVDEPHIDCGREELVMLEESSGVGGGGVCSVILSEEDGRAFVGLDM